MNNIILLSLSRILCRYVLAILLVGMSQFDAAAAPARLKQMGHLAAGSEKIKPLIKTSARKAAARSGNGISGKVMCNELDQDSYSEYSGTYLNDEDYAWFWESPDNIIYEDNQTVLNYSTAISYFYFRSYNDAPFLEAIKIHLDSSKPNNASVRAGVADFETGDIYYSDTQIVADYANNILYWKPDSKYEFDNIFFVLESGELNIVGFEIYSEGNTPEDFLTGSNVSAVASPRFRPASCSFTNPISVEIMAEEGCEVYYTTDGTAPSVDEKYRYNGPIVISATTTFKAIAADANGNTSRIATSTYTCTRHGIGEDYNPTSPGNPGESIDDILGKNYKLTIIRNPSGAGSVSASSYNLKAGAQIRVYANNDTGFKFLNWTIEGEEVSKSKSFNYVMPEYDVTLVANFIYDPDSPGNPSPEEQKVKHPVAVRSIPSGVASFSPSGVFDMEENTTREIYAYPNSGWQLTGWTINGEEMHSSTSPIEITMGEKALDIAAYFNYNPTAPSNPGANYYNPTSGEVIVDDFEPGRLYDALNKLVGRSNFPNISSLIVKGEMTSNDLGNLGNFSNAETIDISRTGGVSALSGYTFSSVGASTIVLPSTISSFGNYVFRNCQNLTSLTIYAQEPPSCNSYTFSGFLNKDNCTVYVPASAIELYNNAEYWKDFTILPIASNIHLLQVNLPADAADGRYKHNLLEIVNINTGVRQKYVISDRLLYTFNGLQKDEQYNIFMYSQAGFEIGRIEYVVIPDHDIEVTFDNLKSLHNVSAKILAHDGTDVTQQASIEWFSPLADGSTTYLRKAVSLGEIPDGQILICRVTLDNKLGVVYVNPEDIELTVGADNKTCVINLTPFRSIELSGAVVDGDGAPLSGAFVSVNQMLNGKYSKTYTSKTDRKGQWNLSVLDASETRLTYAATECVNVNDTIGTFASDVNSLDLGRKIMKSIVGARVSYGFTYHAAGSDDVQDYYSDYQNVAVSIFNVTQNRAHNDVSLQYPILAVLDENINVGDQLRLTATSKIGAFNPIEQTVTVGDDQRAEVTFDIVGKGGITASFEMTDNPAVIAMLYSPNGELLKKMIYTEAKATFTELEDGDYTLVSMGQSDLMNSILRLTNFTEIGLTEGKDYVKNTVKVETGKLAEVKISEVPAFDESLFYYTNSSTGFSANKSSITTGNYLTLRSAIDFKGVYKNNISNVALIVDLPEACDFVEQSVIQGPNLLPYTLDNNRLTVQLGNNYQTQTRFCVIPTAGGSFNATASIAFDYNGKTITQPIGTAVSEIKDIEISVPPVVSKNVFYVVGTALSKSQISIFDGKDIIGSGQSNSNGEWNIECVMPNPQNLSAHSIHANIITPSQVTLISETKDLLYDIDAIEPISVTMTFYNGWLKKNVSVIFDILNGTNSESNYMFYTTTDITFIADFTNNSPNVLSNVFINVFTDHGDVFQLPASYDENTGKWIAVKSFGSSNLPTNVSVDYKSSQKMRLDANVIPDMVNWIDELNSYTPNDVETSTEVENYLDSLTDDEFIAYLRENSSDLPNNDSLLENIQMESQSIQLDDGTIVDYIKNNCSELNESDFNNSIYNKIEKTDGTYLYLHREEGYTEIIDFVSDLYLSMRYNHAKNSHMRTVGDGYLSTLSSNIINFAGLINAIDDEKRFLRILLEKLKFNNSMNYSEAMARLNIENAKVAVLERKFANAETQFAVDMWASHLNDAYASRNAARKVMEAAAKTVNAIKSFLSKLSLLSMAMNAKDGYDAMVEWHDIMSTISSIDCPGMDELYDKAKGYSSTINGLYLSAATADLVSLKSFKSNIGIISLSLFNISIYSSGFAKWMHNQWTHEIRMKIPTVKCNPKNPEPPIPPKIPKNPNIPPIHDPSGFVYEAVPANRVEGVQATIYYKETKEDMYGDPYEEVILWNAEEYAQENPLFTDEYGMYQWDVPQGLWQVKFEKDGYVTAYSEWLPVPPPQLEVNIGIVQNKQPEVTEARAYEGGVEVQFDKFMDLSTLTAANIYVTANGEKLNGEVRLIDLALADEYASEDDANAIRYASRIRFVPEEKLSATTGEIRLTVSRNVLSYVGIPMTETFSQVLDVEKEVQMITAEDVKVLYGGEKEVTVYALPFEAAVGRTLHIANSSDLITSVDTTKITLDEEGKAVVKVKGELPGRTQLTFTIDDVTATGSAMVDVVTEIITAEAPKASRASGTAVYRGTKIVLTTESKNATIYFTTDGSCPCDENGTRRKYTVPIIINEDTRILAMTSVGNGNDDVSETVEFNYTLKRSDMDFQMPEGWSWISHNFASPLAPSDLAVDKSVLSILSQTQKVVRDPKSGMIGSLTELSAAESYKVETSAATERQRLSGIAWNPATPILLNPGWNWLGYPVGQAMTVDEAFANTAVETLDVVVGQTGFAQFDGEKWIGTLETMTPGMGYMYLSRSAKNVVYNTSIVSKASAKYAPRNSADSPLVLDIHKYGMIMPVVATLVNMDGLQLDNGDYQVAAFCGTECRGIGKVVNGLVMMNVYGNINDNITIQVTDADGEKNFDNNASLMFGERVEGNIYEPYIISIDDKSGIANVKCDGNVNVIVEGDMLRIRGIAASDIELVEVYDINGQKLIRETDIRESGVRISSLLSGVYVVIVCGNGEYSYHKIVIR